MVNLIEGEFNRQSSRKMMVDMLRNRHNLLQKEIF